ncbi:isochorismatase [Bdellovibrio bacteriovorus W]|nr:isochorismatase [Bdellovibrio bacteriovorus W]
MNHETFPGTALIIIDIINTLAFPEGGSLLDQALPIAKNIVDLKRQSRQIGIPVVYVNDNFGKWHSDWKSVYGLCSADESLGAPLAKLLEPFEEDYFVLKPRHSGFYNTCLDVLLGELQVHNLILTGIAGNICVLFTAHEAHMRKYNLWIPSNCTASNTPQENEGAMLHLNQTLQIAIDDFNQNDKELSSTLRRVFKEAQHPSQL